MMYAVFNEQSELISLGTVLADPMPEGYTYRELLPDEVDCIKLGGVWNSDTMLFELVPPPQEELSE